MRALGPGSSIFARVDVLIGRAEHLAFEHQVFDGGATADSSLAQLRAREGTPMARFVALLWSVSNGDAFLSLVTISLLTGHLWEGQLFFAVAGVPWMVLVVALNARFARGPAWSLSGRGRSRGRAPAP